MRVTDIGGLASGKLSRGLESLAFRGGALLQGDNDHVTPRGMGACLAGGVEESNPQQRENLKEKDPPSQPLRRATPGGLKP